tara:strand:+ start:405 stop:620 length:216 start_codon:yes stop_codon:yes gene_type:complete
MKLDNWLLGFSVGLLGFTLLGLVLAFLPFWLLWNWLMPLFGLPELTFLQSVGLYLLLRLIFWQINYTKEGL